MRSNILYLQSLKFFFLGNCLFTTYVVSSFALRGLIKIVVRGVTQSSFLMSPFDVIGSAMSPYVGGSTYRGR